MLTPTYIDGFNAFLPPISHFHSPKTVRWNVQHPVFHGADIGSGSQGDSREVTEQESEVLAKREQISGWPLQWSFSKL